MEACTRTRCHRLTVCLFTVGGLFSELCGVVGGFCRSADYLGGEKKENCDCLARDLRGYASPRTVWVLAEAAPA